MTNKGLSASDLTISRAEHVLLEGAELELAPQLLPIFMVKMVRAKPA